MEVGEPIPPSEHLSTERTALVRSGTMPERIVVIGGNAAGMSAASRAKRLNPELRITVIELSHFISYSICGLPHYISKKIQRHDRLITFSPEELKVERGITARTRTRVEEIYTGRRRLLCVEMDGGREWEMAYDRVVIATGYRPKLPRIDDSDLDGIFTVSRLEDGIRIREEIETRDIRRVAIVGGGYIGLMMAHGLRSMGLEVVLFERHNHVFRQVDEDMAVHVEEELRNRGVKLVLGTEVKKWRGREGRLEGIETKGGTRSLDMVVIDVGILPNTQLAVNSGIPLGISGAILVDERGQTRIGRVYAAGNCAETTHLSSGKPIFSALGTSAAKQGRVVGENLAGRTSVFGGTLETSVEKVFDVAIARTGLTSRQAFSDGFRADSVKITHRSRADYYPGSREMHVKLIFDKDRGRLLGGQIVGDDSVAKRIDTLVAALSSGMTLQDISQLDLAYAPPYGTLWDPIQIAANVGLKKLGS